MPLTIGHNYITGATSTSANSIGKYDFANGSLVHKYDLTKKATLVTGITDSGTSITRTYTLSNYVVMPANTVAVILRVQYVHGGSTNHGYFYFRAYQSGYSTNCTTYEGAHYDWYYNTTNETMIVPWNVTTNWDLKIESFGSYNTSSSNYYNIHLEGIIQGVNS